MSVLPPIEGAVLGEAILNVIGSFASAIGAGAILICYALLPERRHFRHALIINLALSDTINAINNTSSGMWIIVNRAYPPFGSACVANGLIGQLSVQATDCSILLIAIITLMNIRKKTFIQDSSTLVKVLTCMTAWILPIITSFIALGFNLYVPVNGNWCWIAQQPQFWRYTLTHGWRLFIIIASICIYSYIYFYIRKRFKTLRMLTWDSKFSSSSDNLSTPLSQKQNLALQSFETQTDRPSVETNGRFSKEDLYAANLSSAERGKQASAPLHAELYPQAWSAATAQSTTSSSTQPPADLMNGPRVKNLYSLNPRVETHPISAMEAQLLATEKRVRKTLLLNGYPLAYVILWLPGVANRIYEAITGGDSLALGYLQASTQFVGLANALTYGLNENMVLQLRERYWGKGKVAVREDKVDEVLMQKKKNMPMF